MELVQDLLYILLTAAVPVLTTYLCKFLYEKWTGNKDSVKNEHIKAVLEQVVSMVCDVVAATTQTYVDELKKNGEFTKEAATEAFKRSKETAMQLLTEEAKDIISKVYGNIDVYLDTLIEATVKSQKKIG